MNQTNRATVEEEKKITQRLPEVKDEEIEALALRLAGCLAVRGGELNENVKRFHYDLVFDARIVSEGGVALKGVSLVRVIHREGDQTRELTPV